MKLALFGLILALGTVENPNDWSLAFTSFGVLLFCWGTMHIEDIEHE